jgi:hypothetical protein
MMIRSPAGVHLAELQNAGQPGYHVQAGKSPRPLAHLVCYVLYGLQGILLHNISDIRIPFNEDCMLRAVRRGELGGL